MKGDHFQGLGGQQYGELRAWSQLTKCQQSQCTRVNLHFLKLQSQNGEVLTCQELKIIFEGEMTDAANDAGGMSKEWFSVMCEDLLNPDRGEFRSLQDCSRNAKQRKSHTSLMRHHPKWKT